MNTPVAALERPYHLCLETMSSQLRLKILELLKQKPMTVLEMAEKLQAERSRVSHALQMLRICNIVAVKKQGKNMIYSLQEHAWPAKTHEQANLFKVLDNHIDHYCKTCNKMQYLQMHNHQFQV